MAEGSSSYGSLKRSFVEEDESRSKPPPEEDLAQISRRIANALEPKETIARAFKRLKGSAGKRQKMSAETKLMFDQLTDDAMKLIDNGDYDVYDEKREYFVSRAEDYDKLAQARKPAAEIPATTGSIESSHTQSEVVYDESSGYYYNNSTGYYYDPRTEFYFHAATQKWYYYDAATNTYYEVYRDLNTPEEITMHSDMLVVLQWSKKGLTIHGGWPNDVSSVNYSNIEFDYPLGFGPFGDTLIKDLHEFWPSVKTADGRPKEPTDADNVAFWKHEWDAHGRYSGLPQDVYFRRLVDFVKSFPRAFGLPMNTPIPVHEIINQIQSQIGVVVRIRGWRVDPNDLTSNLFFIDEINIKFDVHLKTKDVGNKFAGDITCETDKVIFRTVF